MFFLDDVELPQLEKPPYREATNPIKSHILRETNSLLRNMSEELTTLFGEFPIHIVIFDSNGKCPRNVHFNGKII